jgi:hypothetical protein
MLNFSKVKEGGRPSWDEATGFAVTGTRPLGILRGIGYVFALSVMVLIYGALAGLQGA